MRLLYPCDPFDAKRPDEAYQDEFDASVAAGLTCSLFSVEDFERGDFRPRPTLQEGDAILYRGWMLGADAYSQMVEAIRAKGAVAITSPDAYRLCHYLPGWYEQCKDVTPETVFVSRDANFVESLSGLNWPGYFVKDYVKSLTTSRGSVAHTPEEVSEVVSLIENYRGQIEGGVCIRRFENLLPETEERYFVLNSQAHGRDGLVPPLVREIAAKIASPFFSVDVVSSTDGTLRLIELGDGQVSDRKLWPAERFVEMFRAGG